MLLGLSFSPQISLPRDSNISLAIEASSHWKLIKIKILRSQPMKIVQ